MSGGNERDLAMRLPFELRDWSGDPRRPIASTAFSRLIRFAKLAEPGKCLSLRQPLPLLEGDHRTPALRSLGERAIPDFDEPVHLYELVESQ
jgi:hypothetical protein